MIRYRLLLLACALVSGLLLLALAVQVNLFSTFDRHILLSVNSYSTEWWDSFFTSLTLLGGWPVVCFVASSVAVIFALRRKTRTALLITASVFGSLLLNLVLKGLFDRARPELWMRLVEESSFSFPSGHATASAALGIITILIARRSKWRWWIVAGTLIYIGCIGLSRLYLGVHYPTDILGGWLLAASWITLMVYCSHAAKNP